MSNVLAGRLNSHDVLNLGQNVYTQKKEFSVMSNADGLLNCKDGTNAFNKVENHVQWWCWTEQFSECWLWEHG